MVNTKGDIMHDAMTANYFNTFKTRYKVDRYKYAVDIINKYSREGDSLLDVGSGCGNILEFITANTKVKNVSAIDVSENYLTEIKTNLNCDTFHGSIIDANFLATIKEKFSFILMGAVIHHLVGRTRRQSMEYGQLAILNCLNLLKDGGYLIIFEPTFSPSFVLDAVFYVKRLLTMITSRRIEILGKWNNLGAPVVSFYTNEQLLEIINKIRTAQVVDMEMLEGRLSLLKLLAFLRSKTDTTIVLQKRFS